MKRQNDDFLSVKRAAARADMSEDTIRWMAKQGLPVYRFRPTGKMRIYWPEFVEHMQRFRVVMSHFDPDIVALGEELLSGN